MHSGGAVGNWNAFCCCCRKLKCTGYLIALKCIVRYYIQNRGLGSSVVIATGYGLDGPGIEFRWGQDFQHLYRPALGPIQPPVQWVPSLSWGGGVVKSVRGVTLTPHPLLVPRSWKSRAVPLLPLWAVRLVQGLSACTRMHFTFTFTLHVKLPLSLF
jgi:hypothetical protein